MATNRALSNAPYSVTLTKDGVLYSTAVYGNETAAIHAVKQVVEAMGANLDQATIEDGYQEVGAFTVYYSMNGDTDSLISHFAEVAQ